MIPFILPNESPERISDNSDDDTSAGVSPSAFLSLRLCLDWLWADMCFLERALQ